MGATEAKISQHSLIEGTVVEVVEFPAGRDKEGDEGRPSRDEAARWPSDIVCDTQACDTVSCNVKPCSRVCGDSLLETEEELQMPCTLLHISGGTCFARVCLYKLQDRLCIDGGAQSMKFQLDDIIHVAVGPSEDPTFTQMNLTKQNLLLDKTCITFALKGTQTVSISIHEGSLRNRLLYALADNILRRRGCQAIQALGLVSSRLVSSGASTESEELLLALYADESDRKAFPPPPTALHTGQIANRIQTSAICGCA